MPEYRRPLVGILDTNVLTELMRPQAVRRISAWIAARARGELHSIAVMRYRIRFCRQPT